MNNMVENNVNQNPLISIIVPVYNVEKYLKKCIDSIINQTYKNLEILLIDDGSEDASGLICDHYAKVDKRIIVIHKKNGGLSDARNVGIKRARGKYLSFIDSDDNVDIDLIEYLYFLIKKYNAKMSICTHYVVFDGKKKIKSLGNKKEGVFDARTCIRKLCYHDNVDTSAWAKLYDAEIFKDIEYPLGKLFEDIGTTYKTFIKSKTIAYGFNPKYYYHVRINSIVTSKFSVKKLDLLEMTDKMGEDVLKLYPDLTKAVLRRRIYARFSTLNQIMTTKEYPMIKNRIIKWIKQHTLNIILDKQAPVKDKIAIIILLLGESIYKYVWENYKKNL